MPEARCSMSTGRATRRASFRVAPWALCIALFGVAAPANAQISLVGEWVGRYHEDFQDRIPGPDLGDYTGLPVNDAARRFADSWDPSRVSMLEHQCQPYVSPHIYRGPLQFRIWEDREPAT